MPSKFGMFDGAGLPSGQSRRTSRKAASLVCHYPSCSISLSEPCTDAVFRDSHAIWAQHSSGAFAQIDLRTSTRPIDAVPRVALSWNVWDTKDGSLAFITDRKSRHEVPYDDV